MRDFLFRTGTPLTAGLFLVSTISGVALFFGWQPGWFHSMHEILSMVLLVPVAVHLWRNWRPLMNYFRRLAMPVALAGSLIAGGLFAYQSAGGPQRGNPAFALIAAAQKAPIARLAPVLGLDAATAAKRLEDAGYGVVAPEDTIEGIAARNNAEAFAVIARLTAPAS